MMVVRTPSPRPDGERVGVRASAPLRRRHSLAMSLFLIIPLTLSLSPLARGEGTFPARIAISGDSIPDSLTGVAGDPVRGRAIVMDRQVGLCLLCHSGPFPETRFQGNLAPDLAGAGARWSEGQLRLRMVDASRFNPDTIMPSYYRIDGLQHVAKAYAGKPLLEAQEIEDIVAFLTTLKTTAAK